MCERRLPHETKDGQRDRPQAPPAPVSAPTATRDAPPYCAQWARTIPELPQSRSQPPPPGLVSTAVEQSTVSPSAADVKSLSGPGPAFLDEQRTAYAPRARHGHDGAPATGWRDASHRTGATGPTTGQRNSRFLYGITAAPVRARGAIRPGRTRHRPRRDDHGAGGFRQRSTALAERAVEATGPTGSIGSAHQPPDVLSAGSSATGVSARRTTLPPGTGRPSGRVSGACG